MVVAKESVVAECMIHTGGEQIKGNETRNFRDRGPRIGEERGGGTGGQAGQHKLSSLGQGPTMSPGSQRRASCWSSVLRRDIWAPCACAVLDCWRQGIASQRSPARCLLPCIRALRKKENFQLFHFFVQPLKMVHIHSDSSTC